MPRNPHWDALEWDREPAKIKPLLEQVQVSYRNGAMGSSGREAEAADPTALSRRPARAPASPTRNRISWSPCSRRSLPRFSGGEFLVTGKREEASQSRSILPRYTGTPRLLRAALKTPRSTIQPDWFLVLNSKNRRDLPVPLRPSRRRYAPARKLGRVAHRLHLRSRQTNTMSARPGARCNRARQGSSPVTS